MTGHELIGIAEMVYGSRWRRSLAAELQVDLATLRRWTSEQIKVPGPVALAMRLLAAKAAQHQPPP